MSQIIITDQDWLERNNYPHPQSDNGLGMHSSPGGQQPHGGTAWDNWGYDKNYAWAKEQHDRYAVRWLKVLGDGGEGSVSFCKACTDAGIEVVVRVYIEKPHPNFIIDYRTVAAYFAVGVHYFEFGNEPNLALEWAGMPNDGLVIGHSFVVALCNQIIANVEQIARGGGICLLPALAPGNENDDPDLVTWQSIIRWFQLAVFDDGRRAEDWFKAHVTAGHIALALHPRYGDHWVDDEMVNIDYPNDPVNEFGRPLSNAEIAHGNVDPALIPIINAQRERDKNPGVTLLQDSTCWRSWELVDSLFFDWLKKHLPQLHTEAGPEVGDHWDGRYIRVSCEAHARVAMETIRRFHPKHPKAVPPWILCQMFWVGWLWGHGSFLGAPWWDNPINPDPMTGDKNLPAVYELERFAQTENFDRDLDWQQQEEEDPNVIKAEDYGIPVELQALLDEWIAADGLKSSFMRHALAVGGGPVTLDDLKEYAKGQAGYAGQMVLMLGRYDPKA
mgnify:CR=1 FL=1